MTIKPPTKERIRQHFINYLSANLDYMSEDFMDIELDDDRDEEDNIEFDRSYTEEGNLIIDRLRKEYRATED